MNIQAELDDRVENLGGSREWESSQWHFRPATILAAARIRPHAGSIPHGCQRATPSFAVRSKYAKVNSMSEPRSEEEEETLSDSQADIETLNVLFLRYRSVLSLVAYRVLGDHNQAEDAVRRCLLSASSSVPRFENEGAFRSWLARVLIDEALLILQEREWVAHVLRTDQDERTRK
jgi:hypothetical protein